MGRRTRVLHFAATAARHPYFCLLADLADRSRFELAFGSLGPRGLLHDDLEARGLPTFALDCAARPAWPAAVLRLAGRLRRWRADVVQTHLLEASLVGLAAARLAGTPLAVLTGHHSHEVPLVSRWKVFWADSLCSRWLAHSIIAPSGQMKDTFIRSERVRPGKVSVVHHGFDLGEWRPSPEGRQRVRAELGLEGRAVFGAVGRLYWVKNYPALLEAFAGVAAACPEAALVIVGEGGERPRLEEQARALGLGGRAVFAGHRADVKDVLAALDVFVHPALAESFGLVIVEAMAMGRPVVSTPVGVAPEVIRDGVNGYLAAGPDAARLGEALRAVLAARERWPDLGAEARHTAEHFTAERMVAGYEAHYTRFLGRRARGA